MTIGKLKELIEDCDDSDYVAVSCNAVSSEYDHGIISSDTANNIGPVGKDSFLDFDDSTKEFIKEYSESKNWIVLGD